MTKESDLLQALKQFVKTIGVPDAIICDAANAQKSKAVKHYCNDIGATLKALERNIPLEHKAELYMSEIRYLILTFYSVQT